MYYIYILYSSGSNVYYVGYSNDPDRRITEHNTTSFNTYTSKHRPWIMKAFFKCSSDEKDAINTERFIKKQKSRKLIEQLCDPGFVPNSYLAHLVRVADVRDGSSPEGGATAVKGFRQLKPFFIFKCCTLLTRLSNNNNP